MARAAVLGPLHLEPGSLKQPLQQEPVFILIFHDHNPVVGLAEFQADNSFGLARLRHHLRCFSSLRRQFDVETRATFRRAFYMDSSTQKVHEVPSDAEP